MLGDPVEAAIAYSREGADELVSLTEECANVTEIPYLIDVYREEVMAILNS